MLRLIFYEKKKNNNNSKTKIKMSSAAAVVGALRVNKEGGNPFLSLNLNSIIL